MKAEELMREAGLSEPFEAWAFGEAPDKLAALVAEGIKCATCSAYELYEAKGEALPAEGGLSVILDSRGEAVCIVRTTKVHICPFDQVSAEHARKEGEGDLSLDYWRRVHRHFLAGELASISRTFGEDTPVVCEEFELVFP